ncbi:hypothetical protein [Haliscomenobacter sp.]|uniref:hypothetical protein n=1 Tax=Haliscomenobacter sp. TaxID=2717303 RepID=UPI003364DFFB
MISASPDRHTFQKQKYIEGCLEAGQSLDDPEVQAMLEMYDSWTLQDEENLVNAEWQKNNMEFDMRTSDWMVAKVRESRVYAQNLYAALCNNEFQKQDVWTILKDQTWAASWRSAGGIVANMRGEGDYIDWYCSGIRDQMATLEQAEWNMLTQEQQTFHKESQAHVGEGMVTDEIREDLGRLAWTVVTDSESY